MVHFLDHTQAIVPTYQGYRARSFHPGKRIILLSLFLSLMLLSSQVFWSLTQTKPSKLSLSSSKIHKAIDVNEVADLRCFKNYLGNEDTFKKSSSTCQPLPPSKGICSLVEELFYQSEPESCPEEQVVQFCKTSNGIIKCSLPKKCSGKKIFTGIFEPNGLTWNETIFEQLEDILYLLAQAKDYKGYVFIKCSDGIHSVQEENDEMPFDSYENNIERSDYVQLFLYTSVLDVKYNTPKKEPNININIIMIDSLSRNHFYRSLSSTVAFLENLKDKSNVTVIDFHLFQALKQRTFESLEGLFSGYVNTADKPFGTYSTPYFPLPLEVLLRKFKAKGYKTLWLEDLCWQWEWGLPKDLKVVNKRLNNKELWKSFKNAIKYAFIDDVDVTLASCDILKYNRVYDPFHNIPAVCFNGKYHHEYLLDYLKLYQESMQQNNIPFFSFTQTNVAHEESGVRVRSLDLYLMKYLEYSQTLSDTVTILFSDHGSTYGSFLNANPQAYVETFSPFLFILLPHRVKLKIGEIRVEAMRRNSHRLVSLIDLHETLLALIDETNPNRDEEFKQKYVYQNGLMANIPLNRTCNNIPLIMSNLCICKNFDMSVEVNNYHYSYAEFGISVLNNMILQQRQKGDQKGFGKCQLLQVKKVRSARELRKSADIIQYKLDVEAYGILISKPELFFLIVEIGPISPSMRLIAYERNNVYSPYKVCKDLNVALEICTCKTDSTKEYPSLIRPFLYMLGFSFLDQSSQSTKAAEQQLQAFYEISPPHGEKHIDEMFPYENPCLFVIRHQYEDSFNIFGLNTCPFVHRITINAVSENLYLSANPESKHLLHSQDLKLLISGTRVSPKMEVMWDYYIVIV